MPFDPTTISNLAVWLKATMYQTTDTSTVSDDPGEAVGRWEDLSGNGYHFTESTVKGVRREPSYFPNGAVEFEGADKLTNSSVALGTRAMSAFFVSRPRMGSGENVDLSVQQVMFGPPSTGTSLYQRLGRKYQMYGGTTTLDSGIYVPFWPYLVHGFTSGTTNFIFYNSDGSVSASTVNNASITGWTLGHFNNSFHLREEIAEVIVYGKELSGAEANSVISGLNTDYGIQAKSSQVVFVGDSLTHGFAITGGLDYPWQTMVSINDTGMYAYNFGKDSQSLNDGTANDMESQAATWDTLYDAGLDHNIWVIFAGTNDLYFGETAATLNSDLETYCAARKSAGWDVVIVSMLPRSNAGTPGDFETSRGTYNSNLTTDFDTATADARVWLPAAGTTYADVLAAVHLDSRIGDSGDQSNTTYYVGDNVHLNSTGAGVVAEVVALAIAELAPAGGGSTALVVQDATHAHSADNVTLAQHQVLAADDATHGHSADNVALTQHYTLAVQDATHAHSADSVIWDVTLVIDDATSVHIADGTTLEIVVAADDAVSAHSADNVTIVPLGFAVANAAHSHTADDVTLVQHHVLAVDDATHAHSADSVALVQHYTLAVEDATHAHSADNVALGVVGVLVVQDAAHAHTADNVALVQHHALTVDDATHVHIADSVALTQHHALTVDDATHSHTAANVTLTAAGQLAVQDAVHAHTADSVALTQHHVLAVQDAIHAHSAESVSLTVALVVADATHAHSVDAVVLVQHHTLAVADATHAHSTDSVQLELPGQLAPQNTLHAHTADNVALVQHYALTVADASHGHTAASVVLSPATQLVVQSATHGHTVDSPSLVVMLIIASAQHSHIADNVSLAQHHILVVQDATHIHRVDNISFVGAILLDWVVADSRLTLWSLVDSSRS